MKRYALLVGCVMLIVLASFARETRFLVELKGTNTELVAKDATSTILFVGDTMLGRSVESLMKTQGERYPFIYMTPLMMSVDMVVANLEGPIMSPHYKTPGGSVRFSFASTTASLLALHNIRVVSLANNHAYDYGVKSFGQTQTFLSSAGITTVGNPYAFDESYVARVSTNGGPILFVALNATHPRMDTAKARAFVRDLKRRPDEYVVVMVHGGEEYVLRSNASQQKLYRGLIDAGADAVVAHHPHVVQEIELYKDKPIFYSLGNFIFDQYFSKDVEQGLALKLTLSKTEAAFSIIPLQSKRSQPRPMEASEATAFLQTLAARSSVNARQAIERGVININR